MYKAPSTDFTQLKILKRGPYITRITLIVPDCSWVYHIFPWCLFVPQFVTSWWAFLFGIFKVDILFYICSPFPSLFPVLTDYTGSEENIDISVLGLPSKLNFPLKTPPSHNHKPEAYPSRPGYGYSEQIHVDGGYLYDRACVLVLYVCVTVRGFLSILPFHSSPSDSIHHVVYFDLYHISMSKCCSKHIMTCRINRAALRLDFFFTTWLIESWALCCYSLLHHVIHKYSLKLRWCKIFHRLKHNE